MTNSGVSSFIVESPTPQQPTSSPLRSLLRDRHVQHFLAAAEFIRDYPDCPDRTAEAERYVRQAMLDFAVGAISDDERRGILEILAFAIPPLPAYLANPDPTP